MSDIVERLREWRHDSWPADPSREAADEIERLRAEVARYRAGLQIIVDADGFWDAPSLARDLLEGKDV